MSSFVKLSLRHKSERTVRFEVGVRLVVPGMTDEQAADLALAFHVAPVILDGWMHDEDGFYATILSLEGEGPLSCEKKIEEVIGGWLEKRDSAERE